MPEIEEWRLVVGYEGIYEISDLCHIRRAWKRSGTWSGRLRKFSRGANGYLHVNLHRDGHRQTFLIHRLMALAFLPPPLPGQTEVCHRDNNPSNDYPDNLYWGTRRENSDQMVREDRQAKGYRNGLAKLTENNVREIRRSYASKEMTQEKLARKFHVDQCTISDIVLRKTWKHIL